MSITTIEKGKVKPKPSFTDHKFPVVGTDGNLEIVFARFSTNLHFTK